MVPHRTGVRRISRLMCVSICSVFSVLSSPPSHLRGQQVQFDPGFPLIPEEVSVVGAEQDLGIILDSALGPDGSVYLAEAYSNRIIALDAEGNLAWQSGRSGEGPGEFRTLYRIAIGSDGTLYAFDAYGGAISRFSPDGSFVDRRQLELRFSKMDGLAATADGRIAIAGITAYQPASDAAVHIFDPESRYVRSFAPPPTSLNPMSLSFSGAGTVALTRGGEVLFVRRIPYEIYHYSLDGVLLNNVIEAPFEYGFTADDAVTITERGRRIEISRPETELPFFAAPVPLTDSTFLVPRREGESLYWDIFTLTGRHVATTSIPGDWGVALGYDAERSVLWAKGEYQLEPVLRRISVRLTSP